MTLVTFERRPLARLVAIVTVIAFLATFLPTRAVLASDADALAEISQGAAGLSTVGGFPGPANAPDTLAAVDLATGAVKGSYPFRLPRARGDAQPSLGLVYASSSGVGFAGMGWTLNLPSIVRKGHAGIPRFQDPVLAPKNVNTPPGLLNDPNNDEYYIDGALLIPVDFPIPSALVPHPGDLQGFRREIDDGARYFFINGTTWIKQTKSGHLLQFGVPLDGGSPSIELVDPITADTFAVVQVGGPAEGLNGVALNRAYRWNLVRDTDESGNTVYYVWDDEHQLLGNAAIGANAPVPTAGTMYLTDIYDTSNMPNPRPPLSTAPPAQPAQPSGTCSPTCPDNGACTSNADCASAMCTNGVCQQPRCAPLCNQGAPCGSDNDCGSLVCGGIAHGGGTCQPPACSPSCGPGSPCNNSGDCESFVCGDGTCQPPGCSPTCNQGAPCGVNGDCGSGVCSAGRCVPPTCSPTCSDGNACNNSGDCSSFVCGGNVCKPPSCAPACGEGNPCGADRDCRSNACVGGKCTGTTGILGDLLGMVEKEAHAQAQPAAAFAHHIHLTWALPDYPGYPTELGQGTSLATEYGLGLLVAPYAYSPIWKALPLAQLTTVDVFSASWTASDRQLVREYQLQYDYNKTQTLSFLASVQLVGDCDSVGGISEAGLAPAAVSSCASAEHEPPTTYSYYGIGPRALDPRSVAAAAGPPPTILAQTPAFAQTAMPPQMLVDLNGDGVADLLNSNNGTSAAEECFQIIGRFAPGGTPPGPGCLPVDPYVPSTCSVPPNASCAANSIIGPDQTGSGPSSFPSNAANGLTTIDADDSMWMFSVLADWQSTGRNSVLEILPPTRYAPTRFSFSNADALPVYLGQLSDPSGGQVTLQSLMAGFPATDLPSLELVMGYNGGSPVLAPGNFRPDRAFDLDGDGLPDMTLLPTKLGTPPGTLEESFFTTRDRNGVTHPFQALGMGRFVPPSIDPALPPLGSTTHSTATRALADIDGDGLADLVIVNKYDASYNIGTNGPTTYVGLSVLPNRGDGRFGVPNDIVGTPWDGYGNAILPGSSPDPDFEPLSPSSDPVGPDIMPQSQIAFGDLNGDGMADFAVLDSAGLHICLRYGAWWDTAHWQCVTAPEGQKLGPIMIGDIDGSGIRQVIYFTETADATASLMSPNGGRTGPRDGLLQSVSNGLGGQTSFLYDTVHDLGVGNVPVPVWVALRSTTTNGLTGSQAVSVQKSYSYGTPLYDARDALFVGFQSVTETTAEDTTGSSPGTTIKTTFATTTDYDCSTLNPPFNDRCTVVPEAMVRASRSLPELVETSSGKTRLTTVSSTYTFASQYTGLDGRPGVTLSGRTTSTFLWGADQSAQQASLGATFGLGVTLPDVSASIPSPATSVTQESDFDAQGNEVAFTDFGVLGVDRPIVTKRAWALPNLESTGWSYRVMQTMTGYGTSAGVLDPTSRVREMDYAYDTQGRLTRVSAPLTDAVPLPGPGGAPRAAGGVPPGAASISQVTLRSLQYDPTFGNVTVMGNQDNACLANVAYDPLFHQLPSTETELPNGCGTSGLVTSMVFDRRTEEMTSTINPSFQVTVARYDDFGRVAEVDEPDLKSIGGTVSVLHADYEDVGPVRRVHVQKGVGAFSPGATQAPAFVDQFQYVDGLGETRAVVESVDPASHVGQSWVLSGVHASYSNGRVQGAYRPQFASGPSVPGALPPDVAAPAGAPSHAVYDGLGRITSSTDFVGNTASAVYLTSELSVVLTDPEQSSGSHPGSFAQITRDGHGRTIASDVHLANGPQGVSGDLMTTVDYQATGEPVSITQTSPSGAVERDMTYDSLGRMVQNTEPNAGTWTYAYNAEGQLVGTSDARGCGENLYYDPGGRILAADYSPCLPAPAQQPYTAPTITPGTFPYPGAEESYAYDAAGRLTNVADRARSDLYSYWSGTFVSEIDRQLALPGASGAPVTYGVTHGKFLSEYSVTGQVLQWQLETLTPERLGLPVALAGSVHGPGSAPIQVTETTTLGLDGRVAQIGATTSGTLLVSQSFNADGTARSQSFGDAAQTQRVYGYDNNGRLTSYSLVRGPGPWLNNVTGYIPPAAGDASLIGDLTDLSIVPDKVGNPVSVTDSSTALWPAGTAKPIAQSYSYWDDYRLRSAVTTSAPDAFVNPYLQEQIAGSALYPQPSTPSTKERPRNQSFQYDWRGNVSSSTDDADDFYDRSLGTVAGTKGSDRISGATSSGGASSLTPQYDEAGNIVSLALQTAGVVTAEYTYSWDELGHLASATRADESGAVVQESYLYGAGGQRVQTSKSVNGGAPLYTLNVFDSMVLKNAPLAGGDYVDDVTTEELYMAGGTARVFDDVSCPAGEVTCPGGSVPGTMPQIPSSTNSSTIHTFVSLGDARGSGSFVVDHDTGELVERTTYQPYGALDSDSRSLRWESSREDVKLTGQWDNAEVGLVYFGARYYSPQLGRFISPDPLTIHGLAGDPNPYEYAYGSPFRYVDPTGLDPTGYEGDPGSGGYVSGVGSSGCGESGTCPTSPGPQPGDPDFVGPAGSGQVQIPVVTIVGQPPPGGGNDPTQMADFDDSPPEDPPPFQNQGGPGYDGTAAENNAAAAAAVQNFLVDLPSGAFPVLPPQVNQIIRNYTARYRTAAPDAGHGLGTYDFLSGGLFAGTVIAGGSLGGGEALAEEGLEATAQGVASDAKLFQAYRAELAAQEIQGADAVGSALKTDAYHRSASFVRDMASDGQVFSLANRTGTVNLTQVLGEMNGAAGRFEWIVDGSGNLTHQMFVQGGRITGIPIAP
jgi:RHS repeat-associated protein